MTVPTKSGPVTGQPLWTYAPLIVGLIVTLPILFVFFGSPTWETPGNIFAYIVGTLVGIVFLVLMVMPNWGFVALYLATRWSAQDPKAWAMTLGSIQTAMWFSIAAMLVPNCWLVFSSADLGEGFLYLAFGPLVFPLFGLVGWFIGLGVHHLAYKVIDSAK